MCFSSFFNGTLASHKNASNTKDKEYGVSRGIDFQGMLHIYQNVDNNEFLMNAFLSTLKCAL